MKTTIKIFGIFFMAALATSCSKNDDPVDDNLFVGTYRGSVNYTESNNNTDISTNDGKVTVVKVGNTYNFDFSDGIPSLNGVKMEKNQNVLISSDGTIKIDQDVLIIAYSDSDESWGANCSR